MAKFKSCIIILSQPAPTNRRPNATLTPQQFVNKWRNIELKESTARQHFLAHQKLDQAVIAAYAHTDPARNWHPAMSDDQILANLLA